jgi:hypothetical protein
MRAFVKYSGGLVAIYILVYVVLSLCGSYQPFVLISARVYEDSMWAPAGFYDPYHTPSGSVTTADRHNGTWRRFAIVFGPLWGLDTAYVHKTKQDR